jgi:hypothetical protein
MTIYDEAVLLTKQMTISEKVLLLEHLSSALKQQLVTETYRHMPWEQFLELTYGSLAHERRVFALADVTLVDERRETIE